MRKSKERKYREAIEALLALAICHTDWMDNSPDMAPLTDLKAAILFELIRRGNESLDELGFKGFQV